MAAAALALAPIVALAAPAVADDATNYILIDFGQQYDWETNQHRLMGELSVALHGYPDDAQLATVRATFGGKTYTLEWYDSERIHRVRGPLNTLPELRQVLHGNYTITIAGIENSTSTFFFNANALTAEQVYSLPRITTPANGATGVPGSTTIEWLPPLQGPADPLLLELFIDNESVSGPLPDGTTAWNPDGCVSADKHKIAVEYAALTPTDLFTPLTVVSGSITWGLPSWVPAGHPANGPVIATLGEDVHFASFTGASGPADFNCDGVVNGSDLTTLLVSWGGTGEADLNGDGIVDAVDLAGLMAAWG